MSHALESSTFAQMITVLDISCANKMTENFDSDLFKSLVKERAVVSLTLRTIDGFKDKHFKKAGRMCVETYFLDTM